MALEHRGAQVGIAGASAVLLIAALVTVIGRGGADPDPDVRSAADGLGLPTSVTTTTVPAVTATTAIGGASVGTSESTVATAQTTLPRAARPSSGARAGPTAPSRTATSRPSATATTVLCRNSFDRACGPFRWDPPPGPNQPLTVDVTFTPAVPKAGSSVTFRVKVDDPDGDRLLSRSEGTVDYGDGSPVTGVSGHLDCVQGAGPWTTPVPVPVHEELTYHHVYAQPGTYIAKFTFRSLGNCAYPGNDATTILSVTVVR